MVVGPVRHPLAVAASWVNRDGVEEKLIWKIITSQRSLLDDFPIVGQALALDE